MQDRKRDQKLVDAIGEEAERCAAEIGKLTRKERILDQDLADCREALSAKKEQSAEIDARFKAALKGEPADPNKTPDPDADAFEDAANEAYDELANGDEEIGLANETHRPEARETKGTIFDPERVDDDARGDVTGV